MRRAPETEADPRTAGANRRWAPFAAIVGAVAAAYANALFAAFQFDDWNVIVDEPRVRSLAAWWSAMPGLRPILKLTYALQNSAGHGAAAFHAFNVAVHAANACLVYLVLRPLAAGREVSDRAARGVALLAALIFALHPVQTEAVTYVSGRSTSLSACFALASLWTWIDARGRGWTWRIVSPACFAAALLVKETAVVLPLALVLWDGAARRIGSTDRRRRPWAHAAVCILFAAAAAASPAYQRFSATSFGTRGAGANLLTQSRGIVYLAGQLVRFDRLNADPALPAVVRWDGTVAIAALVVGTLLAAGWFWFHRRPKIGFGILWFFLWLAPTNSFVPRLDVANDRQLYLALAGPAWLAAWGALRALDAARPGARMRAAAVRGSVAIALVLVLVLGLGVATHARNRVYSDEISFWSDVVRKSPSNARAFNNLGYAYALASRDDLAESAFREALRLDPSSWRAGVNLRLLREGALRGAPRESPAPPGS